MKIQYKHIEDAYSQRHNLEASCEGAKITAFVKKLKLTFGPKYKATARLDCTETGEETYWRVKVWRTLNPNKKVQVCEFVTDPDASSLEDIAEEAQQEIKKWKKEMASG